MATPIIRTDASSRAPKPAENGFSLIEVVISMAVMTVGMVSLLGVFGLAMAATQTSQEGMIAKQLANEEYESLVTARNSGQINWDAIQNNSGTQYCTVSPSPCGIFIGIATSPQFQPIYNAGADGVFGTADDAAAGEAQLQDPGPDGIFQTADDTFIPLTGYQRAIQIGPVTDSSGNVIASLRSVTITVQYSTAQMKQQKTYILNSYISQYQ